ncbi:hypothetical protein ACOZE3_12415 [Streptomyces cinereoruber]|uniref:hypothetical protein n=1 Tax=Streptomyces cinereoruber TaxID=67260 RepID=UPI003BF58687
MHHIEGQARVHLNWAHRMKKAGQRPGDAFIHFYEVPDLDSIVYRPQFELNYRVWTTKNGQHVLDGRHTVKWHMSLYPENWASIDGETRLAHWEVDWPRNGHTHSEKFDPGIEIKPDTGVYKFLWHLELMNRDDSRSPSVVGTYDSTGHRWVDIDSASEPLKIHLRAVHGM